ncbi:MAG: VWA domain-containing protein [Acidobacteria bacterium]|nr:VWA domain-containing protein [Acidobacteriota bacterium]
MFRFAASDMLFAYLLVPALIALAWWASARKRRDMERLADTHLLERLTATVSRRAQLVKTILVVSAVGLLVTALARPQFGSRIETVRREGRDVLIALDLSVSMVAEDIAPNRLEKAKFAIADLIDRLDGDRVGLVAFAGEAFVQSPLTLDYGAARLFLNAMEPDMMSVQGTNLGQAVSVALDAFASTERRHRVLVVITDGEDHEGEIDDAIARATDEGVVIYTVGIGSTDGVPIPDLSATGQAQGFKRDGDGAVVTTRLDEATLQEMAERTGGTYYRASAGGSELAVLAEELAGGEGREFESEQVTLFDEQYQLFLGLALALLVVDVLVSDRRRVDVGWTGRFR